MRLVDDVMLDALDRRAAPQSAAQSKSSVAPLRLVHPPRPRHRRSHTYIVPLGGALERATDIALAFAALIVLAPLLLLIALIVRLETPGPALFCQRRGGFKGRPFLICKFRTMTCADDGRAVAQAKRDDARITRVGAVL